LSVHSILIVDDDVEFGRLVERVVSGMGHIVEQISRPREIMDRYDKFAPDIIFLDIFMPDMDGIEVANWLAEKRFNGKLVFMTARDPTFLSAAYAAAERIEADIATLEKPARVNEIRALVNEQRVISRQMILKAATIVYQNDSCTMNCTILDLSENGAKLKPTDVTLLPQTFRLMVADGPSYDCEEVRRTHDQIAVRFV
jgi:DNA-binding response OmpR family regulator